MQPIPEMFTTTVPQRSAEGAVPLASSDGHSFDTILSQAEAANVDAPVIDGDASAFGDWIEDAVFALGVLTETELSQPRLAPVVEEIAATPIVAAQVSAQAPEGESDQADAAGVIRKADTSLAKPTVLVEGADHAQVPKTEASGAVSPNASHSGVKEPLSDGSDSVNVPKAEPIKQQTAVPKAQMSEAIKAGVSDDAIAGPVTPQTKGASPLDQDTNRAQSPIPVERPAASTDKTAWAFHSNRGALHAPEGLVRTQTPTQPVTSAPFPSSLDPTKLTNAADASAQSLPRDVQGGTQPPAPQTMPIAQKGTVEAPSVRSDTPSLTSQRPPDVTMRMPEPNTTSASPAPSSQTVHTAAIPNPSIAAISVPPPTQNLSVDRVSDVEGLSMADYGLSDGEKMIADPVRAKPELPNPTLVRHVSQQLIEALRTHTERPVEVMLSPEELGRVKLSLTTAEAGITVHVLAERPETTDLLRRHIDVLTEDFRNLGYQDINFSFGSDGQNEQAEGSDQSAPSLARDTDETTTSLSPITIQLDQSDGLDIRL